MRKLIATIATVLVLACSTAFAAEAPKADVKAATPAVKVEAVKPAAKVVKTTKAKKVAFKNASTAQKAKAKDVKKK